MIDFVGQLEKLKLLSSGQYCVIHTDLDNFNKDYPLQYFHSMFLFSVVSQFARLSYPIIFFCSGATLIEIQNVIELLRLSISALMCVLFHQTATKLNVRPICVSYK